MWKLCDSCLRHKVQSLLPTHTLDDAEPLSLLSTSLSRRLEQSNQLGDSQHRSGAENKPELEQE